MKFCRKSRLHSCFLYVAGSFDYQNISAFQGKVYEREGD